MDKHQYRRNYYQSYAVERPKPRRKTKRGRHLLYALLLVVGVGLAARAVLVSPQFKSHVSALSSPSVAKKPPPAPVNQTLMATQINQAITTSNLEVGVSIIDLTDNTRYDYGLGDTEYIAASTTKLLSAGLFLHEVEMGQASLSQWAGRAEERVSQELKGREPQVRSRKKKA